MGYESMDAGVRFQSFSISLSLSPTIIFICTVFNCSFSVKLIIYFNFKDFSLNFYLNPRNLRRLKLITWRKAASLFRYHLFRRTNIGQCNQGYCLYSLIILNWLFIEGFTWEVLQICNGLPSHFVLLLLLYKYLLIF